MTRRDLAPRRRIRLLRPIKTGLFAAAAFLVACMAILVLLVAQDSRFIQSIAPFAGSVLVAAVVYMAGHLVRVMRLGLLMADARLSLRLLTSFHLFTAGVSLFVPFKLGEVYRAIELSSITGDLIRAVTFVWIERLFDVGLILVLLLVVISVGPPAATAYAGLLVVALLFVGLTLVLVALVPENLRRAGSYIIRRYDANWTVTALRLISEVRSVMREVRPMLHGRSASIAALTVIVWGLESLSFGLLLAAQDAPLSPLSGLLTFLSSVTGGETLPSLLATDDAGKLPTAALAYLAATQVPLALASLIGAIYFGRWRLRRSKSAR